jgi:hypothetical protein
VSKGLQDLLLGSDPALLLVGIAVLEGLSG